MKRWGLVVISTVFLNIAFAQFIDLKEFTGYLDLPQNKLESHLQKKGFKRNFFFSSKDTVLTYAWFNKGKAKNFIRYFQILSNQKASELAFRTTSEEDFSSLEKEIKAAGFTHNTLKTNKGESVLYQKQSLVFNCWKETIDTSLLYIIKASKRRLPRPRDIVYAEDLLPLDSHEYLIQVFGRENVKTDSFSLSDNDKRRCTVIYPNKNRQAIFLWKDEVNLRNISFIIVGEQLNNESKNINQVTLSSWRSKQGVYCGMSLKEIEALNKEPVSFYNWRTDSPGILAAKNNGNINFNTLKIFFNCMNCGFIYIDKTKNIIKSNYAIEENQKVYVGSFVVMPEK